VVQVERSEWERATLLFQAASCFCGLGQAVETRNAQVRLDEVQNNANQALGNLVDHMEQALSSRDWKRFMALEESLGKAITLVQPGSVSEMVVRRMVVSEVQRYRGGEERWPKPQTLNPKLSQVLRDKSLERFKDSHSQLLGKAKELFKCLGEQSDSSLQEHQYAQVAQALEKLDR